MITAWRITKKKHADTAFDGEGARLAGGRWNSPGVPMVYAAASVSLAVLEILVHIDATILPAYVRIQCTFPENLVTRLEVHQLPTNWRSSPAPPELQQLGDSWVRDASSAVLEVPSAVVDTESNYLLNPAHPDFGLIKSGSPSDFEVNLRLVKLLRT